MSVPQNTDTEPVDPPLTYDADGRVERLEGEDYVDYRRRVDRAEVCEGWPARTDPVAQGVLADGIEWRAYPGPVHSDGGLNGYVKFATRPMGHGYDGLWAVPVHGGITYYQASLGGGCVYGFDTSHYRSEEFPRDDADWIRDECDAMAAGVLAVATGRDPEERETLPNLIGTLAAMAREASR